MCIRDSFYRGTGGEDVKDRDIVETVKVGDDLQIKFDPGYNTRTFVEFPRAVHEIKSSDTVVTNQYFGRGLGDDATELRPVKWYKQLEDRFIDGTNSSGSAGQILSSTGSSTEWVNASSLSSDNDWTVNGSNMYPSTVDNIGIGTVSPDVMLSLIHISEPTRPY